MRRRMPGRLSLIHILGAPVESWTYEKIRTVYGEVNGYLADYRDFAADDDSNGPIFLIRALEDCGKTERCV